MVAIKHNGRGIIQIKLLGVVTIDTGISNMILSFMSKCNSNQLGLNLGVNSKLIVNLRSTYKMGLWTRESY
jgi:hypothetical protein